MDALDAFAGGYSSLLADRALQKRLPLSGTFELLPLCNMRCRMCYIVHENAGVISRTIKDVDYWSDLMDQAIDAGMLYALITGGEPFVYPGIRQLLERVNQKPIHLALNTNGTLLDRETVQWLKQTYPGRLNISLYGGSNETYGRLCKNPKGFDQVTNAFGLLNEYHIPFRVHTTLTPDNIGDYDRIIDVCNDYQAPLQMVYYMFPPYRKDQGMIPNDGRFSPDEAAEVAIRILRSKNPDPRQRRMLLEANCACMDQPERYSLYGNGGIACRGGFSSVWVDWRGKISGCGIHTAEQIDLAQVPFKDAWQQIVASSEATRISEKCQYCKYRNICPSCVAAAFCETGDIAGTPTYLCEFSEHYAALLRKELEEMRKQDG